jgi:hypothetical protein
MVLAVFLLVADPGASTIVQARPRIVYVVGDQGVVLRSRRRRRNHYANLW